VIIESLKENKVDINSKVKFLSIKDVYNNDKWYNILKNKLPKIDIVYTGNNNTYKIFNSRSYNVKKIEFVEEIHSTDIRKMIAEDDESWKDMVPKPVKEFMQSPKIINRLKELYRIKNETGGKKCVPE